MAIIQGMEEKNEKKQIFFECYKELNFIFKKIKKLIQVAFFKVGKTSLFNSKSQLH